MNIRNVVIIGSGPAGYTAGLYAARANLSPLLVAGLNQGGQLTQSSCVENWPGAFDFPSGLDLMDNFKKHVEKFNVETVVENVSSVTKDGDVFSVNCSSGTYKTRSVIIATGSSARYLGIRGEDRFIGSGIAACATCDGFFYRRKKVAVIGGGNTAVTDALYLSGLAAETHLIHRRDAFRCEKILTDKLMKLVEEGKIILHLDSIPVEFTGDEYLTGVKISNVKTGSDEILSVNGVFEAIGHVPNTAFLGDLVELDHGYIKTGENSSYVTATSVPGIFAAGDVADSRYQQAIVAAGRGCMAALDVERFLAV